MGGSKKTNSQSSSGKVGFFRTKVSTEGHENKASCLSANSKQLQLLLDSSKQSKTCMKYPDFDEVLFDAKKLNLFLKFLEGEKTKQSPEFDMQNSSCVLFYLEVQQYGLRTAEQRWVSAARIIDKYLTASSELCISILVEDTDFQLTLQEVMEGKASNNMTAESPPVNLFDGAAEKVKIHLAINCYPSFAATQQFTLLNEKKAPKKKIASGIFPSQNLLPFSEVLQSDSLSTLFLIYLAQTNRHADYALLCAIELLISDTSINQLQFAIFIYKAYLFGNSIKCLSKLVTNDDRKRISQLLDAKDVHNIVSIFSSLKVALVDDISSTKFTEFLNSPMYVRYLQGHMNQDFSYNLSFLDSLEMPKGLNVFWPPRMSKKFDLNISSTCVPIKEVVYFTTKLNTQSEMFLCAKTQCMDSESTLDPQSLIPFFAPEGIEALLHRENSPLAYNFIISNNGLSQLYCACLIVYRKKRQSDHLEADYIPEGICIISEFPLLVSLRHELEFIYSQLQSKLVNCDHECHQQKLVRGNSTGILQDTLDTLRIERNIPLVSNKASQVSDMPIIDFSMQQIFTCLDIDDIIEVFMSLLLERKVLLVSSYYSVLSTVAESLKQLMYPLEWNHVYIPVLPRDLLDTLECPTPYLVGIHSSYWAKNDFPNLHNVCVVDLDRGIVTGTDNRPLLGPDATMELAFNLNEILFPHVINSDEVFLACGLDERRVYPTANIRKVFLNFITRLLRGYRRFCIPLISETNCDIKEQAVLFDSARFLAVQDKQTMQFMEAFLRTRTFASLIGSHWPRKDFQKSHIVIGS